MFNLLTAILLAVSAALSYHISTLYKELAGFTVPVPPNSTGLTINAIPYSTRTYWMREANNALFALNGPCPFEAFGSVIVNHTGTNGLGKLVCIGANSITETGDPTLHGETAAIVNCSKILTDQNGPYKLSGSEALKAFKDLSLYTNAESCPMCASATRWANFKELIYGTNGETLVRTGWYQIRISSQEVFKQSFSLPGSTSIIASVLSNETDPLFSWQFDPNYSCPKGCRRAEDGATCSSP